MHIPNFIPYRRNDSKRNLWVTFWLVVFVVGYFWSSASSKEQYSDLMRRAFFVSEQVELAAMRYPQRGTANGIEGIFLLTQAQMSEYIAHFSKVDVWPPTRMALPTTTFDGPFAPDAFSWKALPQATFAGNRRVRWGNLSRREIYTIRRGIAMCVAFRKAPDQRTSDPSFRAPKGLEHRFPLYTPKHLDGYTAIHCADMGRSERPAAMLQAVLDVDNRRLHVTIR